MPQRQKGKITTQRGASPYNTHRWKRERAAFLAKHPSCVRCMRIATLVDHIVPWRKSGEDYRLFWDKKNWQSLCANCHNTWKKRIENTDSNNALRECGADGMPTHGSHHWNS